MAQSQRILTGQVVIGCFVLLFASILFAQAPVEKINYFSSLQKQLVDDGFHQERIGKIYEDSRVYFDIKGVSRFLRHREARLNYDQFTSSKSIRKARKYMKQYKAELSRAERIYGVDREVVTAIILVETQLGTGVGNNSVLSTLSTIAALSDPTVRESFWKRIEDISDVSRERYDKWVARKSKWAYNELKAFLKYTDREKINPLKVKGSYAGALGISQFMPSNILIFARDGDNDGRIDLFCHADAIASVANYLKRHGWQPQIDRKKAKKVIWYYNRSKYYVDIIFKISDILKG
ncbi:MAG: lytic murein transglycosylase [Deltaproteobacteria bacterium]|nr:lytic murein transglycosylase [Deltaproteobacteria bacterium]MBW1962164.1 lytic murein transglycosylase [Deltaproteobacteria bacterium]MBW1994478.1 lytic murein transglycosylase [Deltaproteobacteria bacterium]MBW2152398.1 lytic murein transglycosylase [Deltaproteobacteria bacterium]